MASGHRDGIPSPKQSGPGAGIMSAMAIPMAPLGDPAIPMRTGRRLWFHWRLPTYCGGDRRWAAQRPVAR
jgi:hypothetical protein